MLLSLQVLSPFSGLALIVVFHLASRHLEVGIGVRSALDMGTFHNL